MADVSVGLADQRQQVADAVMAGYLDANLAADLTTAKGNGYVDNGLKNTAMDSSIIGGINS